MSPLTTDMPALTGYLENPLTFTKTVSSEIASFAGDVATFSLGSTTIINHDIVIIYKLTNVGRNPDISLLPVAVTALQGSLVEEADTIFKKPASDPQVDIVGLRKFTNGVHDTIILRDRT